MYDESVFLQAPASGRSEEGRALLVTRERCMFDVRVRILRLCVFVCVVRAHVCETGSADISFFPSLSGEMLPASSRASLSQPQSHRSHPGNNVYTSNTTANKEKNSFWFVSHKGVGRVAKCPNTG